MNVNQVNPTMNDIEKLRRERENLQYQIRQIDNKIANKQRELTLSKFNRIKSRLMEGGLEIRTGHSFTDESYKFLVVAKDLPEISHIDKKISHIDKRRTLEVMVYTVDGSVLDYYNDDDDRFYGSADNEYEVWFSALITVDEKNRK